MARWETFAGYADARCQRTECRGALRDTVRTWYAPAIAQGVLHHGDCAVCGLRTFFRLPSDALPLSAAEAAKVNLPAPTEALTAAWKKHGGNDGTA
jgi:hypothetical protein